MGEMVCPTVVQNIFGLPNPARRGDGLTHFPYVYLIEDGSRTKIGISKTPRFRAENLSKVGGSHFGRAAYAGPYQQASTIERDMLASFNRMAGSEWVNAPFDKVLSELSAMPAPQANPTDSERLEKKKEQDALIEESAQDAAMAIAAPFLGERHKYYDLVKAMDRIFLYLSPGDQELADAALRLCMEKLADHFPEMGLTEEAITNAVDIRRAATGRLS